MWKSIATLKFGLNYLQKNSQLTISFHSIFLKMVNYSPNSLSFFSLIANIVKLQGGEGMKNDREEDRNIGF